MNNLKYPKGSEWRKWDLHVHTKSGSDYTYASEHGISIRERNDNEYPKVFIEHIYSIENLGAIGITDHNKANWIDRIIAENEGYANLNNCKKITILPGVEIESSDGIHLLIIFNPETQLDEVKNNYRKSTWKETIEHFLTAIRILQNTNSSKTTEKIMEEAKKWDALCIFAHVTSDKGFFKISSGSTKKRIYKHRLTQIFQIPIDGITNIGQKNIVEGKVTQYSDEQGHSKPIVCITASDAKKLEDIGKNNCWIKADPTFEGLKQIIYEPELRVSIREEDPRENVVYARIEKFAIEFPPDLKIKIEKSGKRTDFCLQRKYEVEFSNNLTCVIGGRGTGKSTLVHLLYNACQKDISELEKLSSPVLSLDLPPDPLRKLANLTTIDIPANTEFFLQNGIEKFAKDVPEMSNLIRFRLLLLSSLNSQISLEDLQNEWSMALNDMNKLIESHNTVSNITQKLGILNKQIETLKKQTAVIKSKKYKDLQKGIDDTNNRISAFRRYENEYTDIVAKIDMLITAFSQLNWSKEQGKDTLGELSGLLRDYKKKLKEIFNQLATKFKTNDYSSKLAEKKLQLKEYLGGKGITKENIEELANASEQIKELQDETRILERQKVPFEETYKGEKSTLNAYKEKYSAYQDRFFEVAKDLGKQLKGLPFFDKAISFTPTINAQRLREDIVAFVKESSPAKVTLRTDDIQSVLFDVEDIAEYIEDKDKIRISVNRSTKTILHKQILQELVNDDAFLEKLYLLLYKEYYDIGNIQVQTKLGDKLLQNTSFGERCGIVVSIILIAGTNPIVIDQPEDNLDGKFISKVLVPLVRKRKLSRQIILVTRDANIVIGGDADLIHILENDENEKRIKILPTSIENIKHRESYIWILDGGEEAFEKRERKYGFKTS